MRSVLPALCAAVLTVYALAAAASPDADIKYRQSVMKTSGGHMGALAAIVKGQVPHKQDIAMHVEGLAGVAAMTPHLFPAGSDQGKTKAKSAIWSNAAEFDAKVKDFQTATAALQAAAKGSDPAALGAAVGGVGKSCKGCHDKFQKE